MNSRFLLPGFAVIASLVLATGCRVSQSSRSTGEASPEADSVIDRRAEAHAHYAQAVLLELDGRKNESLEEYQRAAQLDPGNEELVTQIARSWLIQKKPDRAIEILKLGAEQPGATAMMDVLLGTAYAQAGKADLAVQANRRAIQKAPKLLAGHQNLFAGYLQNGETDAALKVLDKAAGLRNPPPDYLIGLAELYASVAVAAPSEKTNVFAKSLALFDRAAALNPTNIHERIRLADGLNLVGESARAATMYQAILADYPQAPMLQENLRAKLTYIYLRGQDRKRALEQLEVLLRDDPLNVEAHYYAALIFTESDEPAKAEEHLRKVVVLNPKFEQAYYDLAMAQLRTDKTNEIITTLQTAQKKFGQNFISEFLFGLAEARREKWENAVKHFTSAEIIARASDTNRLTAVFYHQFGAALERKGDYSEAVKCLQKALELNPDFPDAANHLGYMWAERGENLERAHALIAVAVKAEPKNEAYLDSMAWVLFKLGKPRDALPFMQQAIGIAEAAKQPDATLYDHLGDIHFALGNRGEARKAWSAALKLKPDPEIEKKLAAELGN
jgi:tetratricopeptide (TPR) repeat protein